MIYIEISKVIELGQYSPSLLEIFLHPCFLIMLGAFIVGVVIAFWEGEGEGRILLVGTFCLVFVGILTNNLLVEQANSKWEEETVIPFIDSLEAVSISEIVGFRQTEPFENESEFLKKKFTSEHKDEIITYGLLTYISNGVELTETGWFIIKATKETPSFTYKELPSDLNEELTKGFYEKTLYISEDHFYKYNSLNFTLD